MYKGLVGALYVLNIVFQAFLTLLTPIGLGVLLSWLLVTYAGVGGWIYAVLVILGVISGLISMVKFVLTASAGYERLEKEQNRRKKQSGSVNNKNGNDL
ncbi:MAG: hypothetical protein J6C39_05170 [Clostridia bacterium]|nr:hypothetical protein [Clostridia bacterium]MBO5207258.1 hypothetical protein [Clostridia bacterium]MBQ8584635.1 hypothetical protein [Clostridia bacterium]